MKFFKKNVFTENGWDNINSGKIIFMASCVTSIFILKQSQFIEILKKSKSKQNILLGNSKRLIQN